MSGFFDMREEGFYVDVGANDPVIDSVTKYFYDRGWKGINIEPLDHHFRQLQTERPRDVNLKIGVGEKEGSLVLREYTAGTGLSTFAENMKQEYSEGKNAAAVDYVDHTVSIKTLAQIFKECKPPTINFMKVDVEGFEYEVLAGNDWKRYRPEVICIEANHIEKHWPKLLKSHDYVLAFFDGLNEYYVDKHKPERLKRFSYVDTVIFQGPVISHVMLPAIEGRERLQQRVQELEQELDIKNQHLSHLEGMVREITPLRRHMRRQAKNRLRSFDRLAKNRLSRRDLYVPRPVPEKTKNVLVSVRQVDADNFKRYNDSRRKTFALSAYLLSRKAGITLISRLLKMGNI